MAESESSLVAAAEPSLKSLRQWQRLSPIALLYFTVNLFRVIFGNVAYLAPTIILLYQGMKNQPLLSLAILLGIALVLLTGALLSYYMYKFRVIGDTVEIRSGVIKKKQLNLPFSRIQNVRLLQPLYYRLTNHVCLQLDTAGSNQQEAKLVALQQHLAQQLQQEIHALHQTTNAAEVTEDNAEANTPVKADEQLLNQRSIGDLVIHGISNNRVWLMLGLAAPFLNLITKVVTDQLEKLGLDLMQWFDPEQQSWLWIGMAALALTLMVMFLLTLISIGASVLSYYGFTLVRSGERYIRRCGLLTRHEVSMKLARLQWVALKQDWLDRLLGRCNVRFEQINAPMNSMQPGAEQGKIMVPSVQQQEAFQLLADAQPGQQLTTTPFQHVNWRFLARQLLLLWLPIAIASQWLLRPDHPELATLGLLPLAWLAAMVLLRWRRWGYAMDQEFIYIRKGLIGIDYYSAPVFKVQQVKLKQNWLLRRAGLCHIQLVFASGALDVPFIPKQHGQLMLNYCLHQAQSSGKSWM
ncbi:MAG: PH domain-containing protein [Alkalimonas sp.]|nr:PH domain-containing protein [Alkalimonas sp.]